MPGLCRCAGVFGGRKKKKPSWEGFEVGRLPLLRLELVFFLFLLFVCSRFYLSILLCHRDFIFGNFSSNTTSHPGASRVSAASRFMQ
jgi:hypothetical protein